MAKYSEQLKPRLKIYYIIGLASLIIGISLLAISFYWNLPNANSNHGFSNILMSTLSYDIRRELGANNINMPMHGFAYSLAKNIMIICFGIILYFMLISKQKMKILFQIIVILIAYTANEYRQACRVREGGLYINVMDLNETKFANTKQLISNKINSQGEINVVNSISKSQMDLSDWRFQDVSFNYLLAQYYYIKNRPSDCYNALLQIDEKFWLPTTIDQRRTYIMMVWLKNNNFDIKSFRRLLSRGAIFLPPDYKVVVQPYIIVMGILLILSTIISATMAMILFLRIRRMNDFENNFYSKLMF